MQTVKILTNFLKQTISILILIIAFFHGSSSFAQSPNTELSSYTFEEVDQLRKSDPRPILVFFHTDWCKYCQLMKSTTFNDSVVISILNEQFYFISFDAECKEDIQFAGASFKYQPNGISQGVHEICKALATIDGKLTYPTMTILNEDLTIASQTVSALTVVEFLQWVGEK